MELPAGLQIHWIRRPAGNSRIHFTIRVRPHGLDANLSNVNAISSPKVSGQAISSVVITLLVLPGSVEASADASTGASCDKTPHRAWPKGAPVELSTSATSLFK